MKKIAYFHIFGGPPIEKSVHDLLSAAFPEYQVQSFQIMSLLKKKPLLLAWNALHCLKEYGVALLKGHRSLKTSFLTTPFLFSQVKKLAAAELSDDISSYAFSFQLQSFFDTSVPALKNYVYTDHTHLANMEYPGFDEKNLNSKRWLDLELQIYTNATAVFTRSSNITRSLLTDYACPAEKIICVYAGVNTPKNDGVQSNDSATSKNILFVGTDWERKGGPVLLKAFSRVLNNHPDATLTIVGCLPECNLPNCRILGRRPVAELSEYYSQAAIFCLPTLHEPFGVVFVEAMSHGLPVVATAVGAVPDFVTEQTGIIVPPGDETALADALIRFLDNPQKAKLAGQLGQDLVRSRYNWDSVGKAIRQRICADID